MLIDFAIRCQVGRGTVMVRTNANSVRIVKYCAFSEREGAVLVETFLHIAVLVDMNE